MRYPRNQEEFDKWFSTEEQCIEYIQDIRWPNGPKCIKCETGKVWKINEQIYKCSKCRKKIYLLAGTLFHGKHKPLTTWFRAIWWMVAQKNGVSASGIKSILGLGCYRTAWTWLHKLRRVLVVPSREKLKGEIEVDETYVGGKRKGKRGRGAEGKSLVIIGVELVGKKTGRTRLSKIPDASGNSLENFIKSNIEPGSLIITDDWNGYNGIRKSGYKHKIETKTCLLDDEELLPNVHRVASLIKRWLLGTHQGGVSPKHLPYYLDEYTFRYNRRSSKCRGLLFYRLMEQAVNQNTTPYKSILASEFEEDRD